MADRCYPLPGGGHVRAGRPPSPELVDALAELGRAAAAAEDRRRAELTPERRAEEDAQRAAAAARIAARRVSPGPRRARR